MDVSPPPIRAARQIWTLIHEYEANANDDEALFLRWPSPRKRRDRRYNGHCTTIKTRGTDIHSSPLRKEDRWEDL